MSKFLNYLFYKIRNKYVLKIGNYVFSSEELRELADELAILNDT